MSKVEVIKLRQEIRHSWTTGHRLRSSNLETVLFVAVNVCYAKLFCGGRLCPGVN